MAFRAIKRVSSAMFFKYKKDVFKLFESGEVKIGSHADLVLFDLDTSFEVDHAFFRSKSKNSPFIGRKLFGKTLMTLLEGSIVYRDETF